MRTFLLVLLTFFLFGSSIVAQEFPKGFCGSTEQLNKRLLDPVFKQEFEASQELLNQAAKEYKKEPIKRGIVYKIPIVFHVLHKGGIENISNDQINDAVRILNRDFRKLNADTSGIHPAFKGLAADAEIEFVLATKAPNGKCFSGITRTLATSDTTDGFEQVKMVKNGNDVFKGEWSSSKYLNVFICNDLGDGKAGYTYYPYTTSMLYGGIWILHRYIGSFGTSSVTNSRAMTHEVGHWFNLSHVWGSTNEPGVSCGDDDVNDTPITKGWLYSCPFGPTNCSPGVVENVENYMEYSYCSKMFTLGQKARMIAALKSSVGGRNNLWTATNLNNTGTANPQLCLVDFTSSSTVICQNETVTFNDISYNNITSWLWTFPNGTTSTIKNPTYTFSEPGTFTISLKVSNGIQTLSTSKVFTVQKNQTLPYYEDFEKNVNGSVISNWTVVNAEKNASFEVTSQAALSGVKSATLQNFGQNVKSVDELVSAPFDLSDINKDKLITLSFRYAYRKLKSTTREYLYVYLSNDCGVNWSSKLYLDGSRLSTIAEAASWKPSQVNEWVTIHLKTIDAKYWQPGTRIKFMFKNDAVNGGNNLYLDDINLYAGLPSDTIIKTIDDSSKELKFIDFTMSKSSSICLNDMVTFNDVSYNNVTTWLWTFPDGSTSTIKTPSYQFKQSGRFTVNLTVSNGVNTLSKSKEVIVQKNDSLPYYESFENLTDSLFKENWIISNIDSNATFEKTVGIGNGDFGSSSIKLENFGQKIKSKDELISKPFELTSVNKNKLLTLSFRYAYMRLNQKSTEKLSVYLSNDCGQSWTQKLSLFDTTLSKNYDSLSWKPTKKDWNIVHLTNIDSNYWQPNTRFKFVFENDTVNGGNNLYLDDINLYASSPSDTIVKLEEKDTTTASILNHSFSTFKLFPNPVKDIVTIKNPISNQPIEVEITDLVGKIHLVKELTSTNNEFNLSLEKLEKGTYIVVLKTGDVKEIQKIIKE